MTKKQYLNNFHSTELADKIKKLYSCELITHDQYMNMNPRKSLIYQYFTIDTFYYLDMIFDNEDYDYYDIGCGDNFFKKIYSDKFNVIGIDTNDDADLHCTFEEFLSKNRNKVDRAFAINSLHFVPFERIKDRIIEYISMFKKDGKGLITFNIGMMNRLNKVHQTKYVFVEAMQSLKNDLKDKVDFFFVEISDEGANGIDGTTKICFKVLEEIE